MQKRIADVVVALLSFGHRTASGTNMGLSALFLMRYGSCV